MSLDNVVGLIVALVVAGYLLFAMLNPEKL